MKQPVHSIVRKAAIFAGILVCLNCSDCGVDPALIDTPSPRSFLFINGTNNLAQARAEVRASGETIAIPGNVNFGEISAKRTVTRTNTPMTAHVIGVSSTWNGQSINSPVGAVNLIVSSSIPGANAVDWTSLVQRATPVLWILRDRGAPMDVYVTAPGANLATLQKDDTVTKLGVLEEMPLSALHANTAFQVRLTAAGTKNVLVDFGTQPGIPEGHHGVFMQVHSGNTPNLRAFVIDAR